MNETQDNSRPPASVRSAIFGSINTDKDKPEKRQWRGSFEPDIEWLNKPLERGYAKEFCDGCNNHQEVTKDHIEKIFGMLQVKKDPSSIDWSKHFLVRNICDFCIESTPEKFTISFAIGKLPK